MENQKSIDIFFMKNYRCLYTYIFSKLLLHIQIFLKNPTIDHHTNLHPHNLHMFWITTQITMSHWNFSGSDALNMPLVLRYFLRLVFLTVSDISFHLQLKQNPS